VPAPPRRVDADLSASPCGTNVFSLPHHLNENGDRSWNEWRPSQCPEMRSVHVNCTVSSSQRKSSEMIQIEQMVKKCLTFLENPVKVGLLVIDREEANRRGRARRSGERIESCAGHAASHHTRPQLDRRQSHW
jgi:hypothetical protein